MLPGHAIVTGVAGFVGSTLADVLVRDGVRVRGIDCFTDYYDPAIKRTNLAGLTESDLFELVELDLTRDEIVPAIDGFDVIFHQAASAGVRASWADGFLASIANNVTATQRLLEAARTTGTRRFVYASSSSVYGEATEVPMREDGPLRPYSPYGVTKLSAEQLCTVYAANFGVPTVSLRYFTVYGPRQRPDMATHRLIEAALRGTTFPLFGAADYIRDFTFVDDIVAANIAAASRELAPGTIVNVAGGSVVTIAELIATVERATGRTINIDDRGAKPGDVTHTEADLTRARSLLDWRSVVTLEDGIGRQVAWHREHAELLAPA